MPADRAGKFDLHSWGERFVAFDSASGCDRCPEKGRCFVCAVEIAKKAYAAGVEASAAAVEQCTVTLTKVRGFTLEGSLAPVIPIGPSLAAEIRALLPKEHEK